MPTYTYRDKETNEEHTVFSSYSESQEYIKANPHLERVIGAPNIVSGVNANQKIPNWYKDRLKEMKKTHRKGDFGQAID